MVQKDPREHYYTPVWLLSRFCDENGVLWWCNKD